MDFDLENMSTGMPDDEDDENRYFSPPTTDHDSSEYDTDGAGEHEEDDSLVGIKIEVSKELQIFMDQAMNNGRLMEDGNTNDEWSSSGSEEDSDAWASESDEEPPPKKEIKGKSNVSEPTVQKQVPPLSVIQKPNEPPAPALNQIFSQQIDIDLMDQNDFMHDDEPYTNNRKPSVARSDRGFSDTTEKKILNRKINGWSQGRADRAKKFLTMMSPRAAQKRNTFDYSESSLEDTNDQDLDGMYIPPLISPLPISSYKSSHADPNLNQIGQNAVNGGRKIIMGLTESPKINSKNQTQQYPGSLKQQVSQISHIDVGTDNSSKKPIITVIPTMVSPSHASKQNQNKKLNMNNESIRAEHSIPPPTEFITMCISPRKQSKRQYFSSNADSISLPLVNATIYIPNNENNPQTQAHSPSSTKPAQNLKKERLRPPSLSLESINGKDEESSKMNNSNNNNNNNQNTSGSANQTAVTPKNETSIIPPVPPPTTTNKAAQRIVWDQTSVSDLWKKLNQEVQEIEIKAISSYNAIKTESKNQKLQSLRFEVQRACYKLASTRMDIQSPQFNLKSPTLSQKSNCHFPPAVRYALHEFSA